jgi:hypothetical protein
LENLPHEMNRRIILGMGAGQCGLTLLPQVLNCQPATRVTHEELPWLPWEKRSGAPGIRERLARILATRTQPTVGDVASFYLPYIEEAIADQPGIRIVCLQRPREEVVAGFRRDLASQSDKRINHWAKEPATGWAHDPFRSFTFPQYDTAEFEEGIRRYWEEYYTAAGALQERYPEQVRIWDTNQLMADAGVREVLTFVGFPEEGQVVVVDLRVPAAPSPPAPLPVRQAHCGQRGERGELQEKGARAFDAQGQLHPTPPGPPLLRGGDPKSCVILVPFSGFIHHECDEALKELERRGYQVRRVGGCAAIDQGRNQMASDALRDGFEETLWIDSDIGFDPDSVERLREHRLPIVCGIYPKKGQRAIACNVLPGMPQMLFGEQGGLVELLYAGAGFLHVRREVYLKIQRQLQLPMCNERFGQPLIPFFYPLIHPADDGHWYLAEDYAFCERARACGYQIFADTTIRLWHIGTYRYGWEDAGVEQQRYATFMLNFIDPPVASRNRAMDDEPHLKEFAARFPWPAERPVVPVPPERNWLFPGAREVLAQSLSADTRLVVELGSWTGRSTRYIADLAPHAKVVAVDHWEGSVEHGQDPELVAFLPRLYETFLSECWDYRERIIPVRSKSVEGLQRVRDAGLYPDVVYIDADHGYEGVFADLTTALDAFPEAAIVGDDWDWESVRTAVEAVAQERGLEVKPHRTAWRIVKRLR